jgi:hypothetical protein
MSTEKAVIFSLIGRLSQKIRFPFFYILEVSEGKKSTRISLDISPLFLHTVSKLVQTLVITDVLLPKPFLDLGFGGVIRWKSLASEMSSVYQTRESPKGKSWCCTVGGMRSRNGFESRTSPCTARAWKISSHIMSSA